MKRIKDFKKMFEIQMGLDRKSEKKWFWCAFILLIIYLECVVFAQYSLFGSVPFLLSLFYAVSVIPFCYAGVKLCNKVSLSLSNITLENRKDKVKTLLFIICVFAATFFVYFLWQYAFWPGFFSVDSIAQYSQVIYGSYNNWHPVLHTWLFFWLPFKIFHSPAAIITVQLVWFSMAVTYLFYVLYINKCSKSFLFFSWLFIVANPNTAQIMLFPWKDSAMSIFALVLFTQLIQIYGSNGMWLKKWYNIAAFSVGVFLTTSMRHNAVLLTAPVFVILLIFFKNARKNIIQATVSVIIAFFLLNGPIFKLANVGVPGGRTTETVGLPMTILTNVYLYDREALGEETLAFMDSLASPQEWESNYVPGSFNIKGANASASNLIDAEGIGNILKHALEALTKSPRLAWDAFIQLTNIVWRFDGADGWCIGSGISQNPYGITEQGNEQINEILLVYTRYSNVLVTKYLFNFIGTIILFVLFMAVSKIGNGNLSRVFIVLAPMAYNFGTMFLLAGPDFRFFHYNFLIVIPLLYIILSGRREEK